MQISEFERYMVSDDHSEWRPMRVYANGKWTDDHGNPKPAPVFIDERMVSND
jgi:hypothetical protein